jgi:16S rRNA (cytidine1402-2'-O)-methyltransferase
VVLFESPERLTDLLEALMGIVGPDRRAAVGREITKLHEEFVRGTLQEVLESFRERPPRGEITLVLAGAEEDPSSQADLGQAAALARRLLAEGESPSRAAKEVARATGLSRNLAYRVVQEAAGEKEAG